MRIRIEAWVVRGLVGSLLVFGAAAACDGDGASLGTAGGAVGATEDPTDAGPGRQAPDAGRLPGEADVFVPPESVCWDEPLGVSMENPSEAGPPPVLPEDCTPILDRSCSAPCDCRAALVECAWTLVNRDVPWRFWGSEGGVVPVGPKGCRAGYPFCYSHSAPGELTRAACVDERCVPWNPTGDLQGYFAGGVDPPADVDR